MQVWLCAGAKTTGCSDCADSKDREALLLLMNLESVPLTLCSPPHLCFLRSQCSPPTLCSPPALCTTGAQVSVAALCPNLSKSSQKQNLRLQLQAGLLRPCTGLPRHGPCCTYYSSSCSSSSGQSLASGPIHLQFLSRPCCDPWSHRTTLTQRPLGGTLFFLPALG